MLAETLKNSKNLTLIMPGKKRKTNVKRKRAIRKNKHKRTLLIFNKTMKTFKDVKMYRRTKLNNRYLVQVRFHLDCQLLQLCKVFQWIMVHQKEKEVGQKDQKTKIKVVQTVKLAVHAQTISYKKLWNQNRLIHLIKRKNKNVKMMIIVHKVIIQMKTVILKIPLMMIKKPIIEKKSKNSTPKYSSADN